MSFSRHSANVAAWVDRQDDRKVPRVVLDRGDVAGGGSANIPDLGSVSASKERRWMWMSWIFRRVWRGVKRTCRMTGAAGTLANSATPQVVVRKRTPDLRARESGLNGERRATQQVNTRHSLLASVAHRQLQARAFRPYVLGESTSPPASSSSDLSFSASSRSMPSLTGPGAPSPGPSPPGAEARGRADRLDHLDLLLAAGLRRRRCLTPPRQRRRRLRPRGPRRRPPWRKRRTAPRAFVLRS